MWIVAKALHTSPFDKRIADLTSPQIAWILSNHYKDQEEDFEKIKILCRFINPDAARQVFDKKEDQQEFLSESDDEEFMKEIQEHATKKVTSADVEKAFENQGYKGKPIQDLDIIERVDKEEK